MNAVFLEGVGFWAPGLPGWDAAAPALRGQALPDTASASARRPAPALLPPAERRRAPDSVALALQVAAEAVAASGREAATLPGVFTSAYGDLALLDQLCATLASQPTLVSPTKFHNSVHNAAAGYWTIATGCQAASSAVSAWRCSFAAGLLEAAAQCLADDTPVLLVAADAAAAGPLAEVARSEGLLGVALVLAPAPGPAARWRLDLRPAGAASAPVLQSPAAHALQGNAMADALPLCEALAAGAPVSFALPLSAHSGLQLSLQPL